MGQPLVWSRACQHASTLIITMKQIDVLFKSAHTLVCVRTPGLIFFSIPPCPPGVPAPRLDAASHPLAKQRAAWEEQKQTASKFCAALRWSARVWPADMHVCTHCYLNTATLWSKSAGSDLAWEDRVHLSLRRGEGAMEVTGTLPNIGISYNYTIKSLKKLTPVVIFV